MDVGRGVRGWGNEAGENQVEYEDETGLSVVDLTRRMLVGQTCYLLNGDHWSNIQQPVFATRPEPVISTLNHSTAWNMLMRRYWKHDAYVEKMNAMRSPHAVFRSE